MDHKASLPSDEALSLLAAFPYVVLLVDREGVIRWANARSRELLGYPPEELVGRPMEALIPPHLRELHARVGKPRCVERISRHPHHISLYSRQGGLVPVEFDLVPWSPPEGEFVVVLVRRSTADLPDPDGLRRQRFPTHALELAEELSRLVGRDEILGALADGLRRASEADSVSIWEVDRTRNELLLRAAPGDEALGDLIGRTFPFDPSGDPIALAAERGRGEILRRVDAGAGVLGRVLGLRSAILIPLEGDRPLVAVLGDPGGLSEPELMGAQLLVHLASASLRRAGLLEQTQRRLERLRALREIDLAITSNLDPRFTIKVLLDETLARLGADAGAVLLLEPEDMSLRVAEARGLGPRASGLRIPLSHSLIQRVARKRRPISLDLSSLPPELPSELVAIAREEGFRFLHIAPMVSKQRLLGVLEVFHRESPHAPAEWTDFLEALASQAAIAVENANLFGELQRANLELRVAYEATLRSWGQLLELRDRETRGHTDRVAELTVKLARELGVEGEELMYVRWGALLHDIGKLGVPDSIMFKPGKLSEEEWEIMRRHPVYAYEALSGIEFLRPALHIPYCHHERWDGTGYPRGLRGEEIPLAARIFAVVDAWDAMRSERPYRGPLPQEEALREIGEGAGSQFDPRVVEAFLALVERGEV